jgi:hypothetical protein
MRHHPKKVPDLFLQCKNKSGTFFWPQKNNPARGGVGDWPSVFFVIALRRGEAARVSGRSLARRA